MSRHLHSALRLQFSTSIRILMTSVGAFSLLIDQANSLDNRRMSYIFQIRNNFNSCNSSDVSWTITSFSLLNVTDRRTFSHKQRVPSYNYGSPQLHWQILKLSIFSLSFIVKCIIQRLYASVCDFIFLDYEDSL